MFDGLDGGPQVLFIAPADLVRWAAHVRPHLEKMAAGSGGRYQTCDLFAALAAGDMFLWVVVDGMQIICVLMTQIMQYPRRRAMRCIGVVGHRPRRWVHLLAPVEQESRDRFGCDVMEALHPARLARLLVTGGWREFHVLSEKRL